MFKIDSGILQWLVVLYSAILYWIVSANFMIAIYFHLIYFTYPTYNNYHHRFVIDFSDFITVLHFLASILQS